MLKHNGELVTSSIKKKFGRWYSFVVPSIIIIIFFSFVI